MLHVQAPKESEAAGQLLRSSGFRFIRKSLLMRWQGRRVPPIGLTEGFAFRPFERGRDEEALTEFQNALAKSIYETVGFRTFRQMLWYEMILTG